MTSKTVPHVDEKNNVVLPNTLHSYGYKEAFRKQFVLYFISVPGLLPKNEVSWVPKFSITGAKRHICCNE